MDYKNVRQALLSKPYVYFFPLWFVVYNALNIWLNDAVPVLLGLFNLNLWIAIPYAVFGLVLGLTLALVINMIIIRVRELRKMTGASGFAAVGMIGGLITGACPGCVAGILPSLAGLFGAQFILANLPLFGMEIQVVSIGLMMVGVYYLSKPVVCKVKKQ